MLIYRCYMKIILTSIFILISLFARPALAVISPNDPYVANQWYLSKIEADKAWSKISSSPNMIIAVIDSGIAIDHPDLKDNIWKNKKEIVADGIDNDGNGFIDDAFGWDFINNTPDPRPSFSGEWTEAGVSHGTLVAGIIAASGNNGKGVTGVSWQAQIMPLKALNDKGEGKISDVIRAIDYAINNGAHIINLSFSSLNYSPGLQEAIYRAHRAGLMVVAAAGNEEASSGGYDIDETKLYPACYDGLSPGENMVIGVAATDALDQKAIFSSYGSKCVDISAPGISFFNTVTYSNFLADPKYYDGYFSGTSLAAPLVSGALALIAEANPELSREEIIDILLSSSDKIESLNPKYRGKLGAGRLNVNRAVEMAKEKLYSKSSRLVIAPLNKTLISDGEEKSKLVASNGDFVSDLDISYLSLGLDYKAGDVIGDSRDELVLGAAKGSEPRIRIYDYKGKLLHDFLAYDKSFLGGVNISLADLNGDGKAEIIVAPASAGEAKIKIFDYQGQLKDTYSIGADSYFGGLNVASGNIDGKGLPEIVVSFSAGAEPQIRILSAKGELLGIFLAYEKSFRGGVNISVANLDGRIDRNKAEIIVAPGPGREPEIKIFNHHAELIRSFAGFNRRWQNGVHLATGDVNSDGLKDIILSAYPGGAPHVRVFNDKGIILESFYAYSEDFLKGVKAGIIKVNN